MRVASAAALFGCVLLAGCASSPTATNVETQAGAAIEGSVYGGQQPINLAHVYLMQANTTGYGQPSVSLLNAALTGHSDSVGAYVTTNTRGFFSITGDYTCTPGTQVYLLVLQGDAGGGNNTAAGEMGVFGQCPTAGNFLGTIPFVQINEVTTVAATYALAGFATDALHVSSSGTALAQVGIANAFLNSGNIASVVNAPNTGSLSTTPGGGTVPAALVNTMGDIIASCVNSTGPGSPACSTLLGEALSNGTTGTAPTDTASALINIAHNPSANVGDLYGLVPAIPPFVPALTKQPNDFTLALTFTGAKLTQFPNNFPYGQTSEVAVDGSGNVFTLVGQAYGAYSTMAIDKFSPLGVDLSSSSTFVGNQTDSPVDLAVDTSNNIWVLNGGRNSGNIAEFSNSGTLLSGPTGYMGGHVTSTSVYGYSAGMAFNPAGNLVVSTNGDYLTLFSPSGTVVTPQPAYVQLPTSAYGLAYDPAGDLWTTSNGLVKLLPSGVAAAGSPFSGGGTTTGASAQGLAIDHASNVWLTANSTTSIYNNAGQPVLASGIASPGGDQLANLAFDGSGAAFATDFTGSQIVKMVLSGTTGTAVPYGKGFLNTVSSTLAVDGSGNVWVSDFLEGNNFSDGRLVEFVGLGAPVVTPLAAGVAGNTLGSRP